MLYYKDNQFHICPFIAHYTAHGKRQFKYTNDKQWWINFVQRWWHHKDLEFTSVNPTQNQLNRLDEINNANISQGFKSGASSYVESGILPKDDSGAVQPPFDQFTESPDPSNSMLQAAFELAIEDLMDKKAQEKDYKNADRLMAYTSSTNTTWKNEAEAFIQWRDDMFTHCFTVVEDIVNQDRDVPSISEFLDELPTITWP